jgi:hypothetical protein
MAKKVLLGALVGGVVVFVWGMISWMVLPFHGKAMRPLAADTPLAQALQQIEEPGFYVYPDWNESAGDVEDIAQRPFMAASIHPRGMGVSMGVHMLRGFVIQVVAAGLLSLILLQVGGSGGLRLVLLIAVFASVVGFLPTWNWWGTPLAVALLDCADVWIGWLLAGLAIRKVWGLA